MQCQSLSMTEKATRLGLASCCSPLTVLLLWRRPNSNNALITEPSKVRGRRSLSSVWTGCGSHRAHYSIKTVALLQVSQSARSATACLCCTCPVTTTNRRLNRGLKWIIHQWAGRHAALHECEYNNDWVFTPCLSDDFSPGWCGSAEWPRDRDLDQDCDLCRQNKQHQHQPGQVRSSDSWKMRSVLIVMLTAV